MKASEIHKEYKNKKLRMAIMCGNDFEKWEAECVKAVLSLPFVEPVLLIKDVRQDLPNKGFQKIKNYPYKNFLWRFYKRFFMKAQAAQTVAMPNELKNIPCLDCITKIKGKHSEYFSDADIEKIKSHNPDFIIRFRFNIIRGEILNVAPIGVWSYHHSDELVYKGGPAAFWEIYNNKDVTGAILQKLTNDLDNGIVLKKGFLKTIKRSYSANFDSILSNSTEWVKQVCVDIHNGVADYFDHTPVKSNAPINKYPSNFRMVIFFLKMFAHKLHFHYTEFFKPEKWNVGIVKQTIQNISQQGIKKIDWTKELSGTEYKADPFGYLLNGEKHIVYERYNYKEQKAIIATDNNLVLSENHHLSYPFIVEHTNEIYMIPESYQKNVVMLYKLDKANNKWCFIKNLIENIPAVDNTLVFHENKYWLFCTMQNDEPDAKLFIYFSDTLDGNYKAHANNPVKCNVSSSRPAGTPFYLNNALYRPAQDCSETYGGKIILNKITKLNEFEFSEEKTGEVLPPANSIYKHGLHTISTFGDETLIDAKYYSFNFTHFLNVVKKKLFKN